MVYANIPDQVEEIKAKELTAYHDIECLTVTEFGRLWKIHPATVNRWINSKMIPAFKLNDGRWRIPVVEVKAVMERLLFERDVVAVDTPQAIKGKNAKFIRYDEEQKKYLYLIKGESI